MEQFAQGLMTPAMVGWTAAAAGAIVGLMEWYFLPGFVEQSIRRSRQARQLSREQLEGVVEWWKTVIRVVAVSMPLVGFGLATVAD
ncbi:hypothetical protein [Ancylobacter lacus]|uniref:hypothetical protein n=1 Tax=Ancylobacter lacus TaxID=2579970 RepID=UPI001BD087E4|nr:hypothetical protein [Ancylobacter lacus]MBS7539973.1 hypothetical protein [Ancylobacter lacus]